MLHPVIEFQYWWTVEWQSRGPLNRRFSRSFTTGLFHKITSSAHLLIQPGVSSAFIITLSPQLLSPTGLFTNAFAVNRLPAACVLVCFCHCLVGLVVHIEEEIELMSLWVNKWILAFSLFLFPLLCRQLNQFFI